MSMVSFNQLQSVNFDGKLVQPSKVVCVGRNYAEHIKELGNETPSEPVIFVKPNSAIAEQLVLNSADEVHYEGELAFIVMSGKIAGVGFALDLTKRGVQNNLKSKGLPWERAKAFDGSAVFSKFIKLTDLKSDIQLALYIDDKLTQYGSCEQMLYKPDALMTEIQTFMTLVDGDIVLTGTPKGVGQMALQQRFLGQVIINQEVLIEQQWHVVAA